MFDDFAYSNIDFGDAFRFCFGRVLLIGNALAWKSFFRCAGLRLSLVWNAERMCSIRALVLV
jgi:hypothetical protein